MDWQDIIREGRLAKKLSQARLAKEVGTSQATIAKIELKQVESTAHLARLIEVLGLDPALFPDGASGGQDGRPAPTPRQASMPVPDFAKDPAYWAAAAGLVGDVPLFASAEGGEGSLLIERDPIGTVKRPPALQGVKDGYAIYLVGESMSPEFEPGDTLMVNPRLPGLSATPCVFYSGAGDEPRAMVKRLVGSSAEAWRVQQFNPARTFELSRDEWPTCHRIVSKDFRK